MEYGYYNDKKLPKSVAIANYKTNAPEDSKQSEQTKFQWQITWGKIRPNEDDDD